MNEIPDTWKLRVAGQLLHRAGAVPGQADSPRFRFLQKLLLSYEEPARSTTTSCSLTIARLLKIKLKGKLTFVFFSIGQFPQMPSSPTASG